MTRSERPWSALDSAPSSASSKNGPRWIPSEARAREEPATKPRRVTVMKSPLLSSELKLGCHENQMEEPAHFLVVAPGVRDRVRRLAGEPLRPLSVRRLDVRDERPARHVGQDAVEEVRDGEIDHFDGIRRLHARERRLGIDVARA